MGEEPTTLTVEQSTKERLEEDFRHPGHDSFDDAIGGLMDRSASVTDIVERGCQHCGKEMSSHTAPEWRSGVSHWFVVSGGTEDEIHSEFFCSPECARDAVEERQSYFPENPDLVVVGGHEEEMVNFEDSRFYVDGSAMEVVLDIPKAFCVTDEDGEFAYVGEPIWVKNGGKYVQHGTVESLFHEGATTTFGMSQYGNLPLIHHPDPESREGGEVVECPGCGEDVAALYEGDHVWCPDCGEEFPGPEGPEEGDD